jgi:hypothetical protein
MIPKRAIRAPEIARADFPAPAATPPASRRTVKFLLSVGGAMAAAALVGGGFVAGRMGAITPHATAGAPAGDAGAALIGRLDAMEERLRRLEATRPDATAPPPADRFLVGLLHLQSVAATARPWQRELQVVRDLAAPGQFIPALAETLAAHATRGVPTRLQLRERFAALQPDLLAHAPAEAGVTQRLLQGSRSAAAGLGLAAPPPPGRTEAALAGISDHLGRGDLAAALFDAATLDPALQPRIAEWSAQARARLAVEQAIQELLLQSLTAGIRRP